LQQMKPGPSFWTTDKKGAGQGMVPTGYRHTCFSLVQGCRSGQRLCWNIGFGDKTFSLQYVIFLWSLNTYLPQEKTWDITFWVKLAQKIWA
jgi:hypothetical protein